MTTPPNWYKKLFAWTMATAAASYEEAMRDRKRTLFQNLQGTVLEIGPGAGVNLQYLPPNIQWLGLEPNPYMHTYLKTEAQKWGIKIDLRQHTLETSDIANHSIDAVISTLVLCSVPNLQTTLQEIQRILKPGGHFLFIEHVAAPSGSLLRHLQSGIRPLWQIIGDGCCPDRDIGQALKAAGFAHIQRTDFDGPVPIPIVKPHIIGIATTATTPQQIRINKS